MDGKIDGWMDGWMMYEMGVDDDGSSEVEYDHGSLEAMNRV